MIHCIVIDARTLQHLNINEAQKKSLCRTLSSSGMHHYFKMDADVGVGPPPDRVYRSASVGSKEFKICTAGDERVLGKHRVMKPV